MALWGMSCDVYGQYLMGQRSYEKARDQFKKAYDISCEVSGETDEQSLVLLNSLGNDFNLFSSNQTLSVLTNDQNMYNWSSKIITKHRFSKMRLCKSR